MSLKKIKEFLKPTWMKSTIFLSIFLLVLFSFYAFVYSYLSIIFLALGSNWGECSYEYSKCAHAVVDGKTINASEISEGVKIYSNYSTTSWKNANDAIEKIRPYYIRALAPFESNLFINGVFIGQTPFYNKSYQILDQPLLQLTVLLAYWYLLSCAIVWIYEKIRGRKK